jgi:hypothetical protein
MKKPLTEEQKLRKTRWAQAKRNRDKQWGIEGTKQRALEKAKAKKKDKAKKKALLWN